jgi:hypothetical protein
MAKWEEWDMTGFARITRRGGGSCFTGLFSVRLNDIFREDERCTRGVSRSDGFDWLRMARPKLSRWSAGENSVEPRSAQTLSHIVGSQPREPRSPHDELP